LQKHSLFSMLISLVFGIILLMVGCMQTTQTDPIQISDEHVVVIRDDLGKREKIIPYEGKPSQHIDQVYTTEPFMAITFNGLNEDEKMNDLLHKLKEENIIASFFLTKKEIIENKEIVKRIIEHGHTIEISNQESYFVRPKPWKKDKKLQAIAAQQKMTAVIGHSIRPRDHDLKDKASLKNYLGYALSRGGIISLDVKDFPQVLDSIDFIVEEARQINYSMIPLDELIAFGQQRKPFSEIPGADMIQKNLDYENEEPNIFYAKETEEKVVALTFDDYGSDKTVLEILQILEENDIQSTFFLKAKNVTRNPNLAKYILEEGHEIANHSYAHKRSTELLPEELQEDIVKAHQVITEAIQEKPTMLFRPPFGNIDESSAKVISAVGFNNIAMYDVSSYDWNPDYTTDDVIHRVMDNVKPGSVIVMHMSDDIKNLETLPIIIEKLTLEGYKFVKMSEWFDE